MLPFRSWILDETVKQRRSVSLSSILQCPHFRGSRAELICKKDVLKNLAKFAVFSLARMFLVNFAKF